LRIRRLCATLKVETVAGRMAQVPHANGVQARARRTTTRSRDDSRATGRAPALEEGMGGHVRARTKQRACAFARLAIRVSGAEAVTTTSL